MATASKLIAALVVSNIPLVFHYVIVSIRDQSSGAALTINYVELEVFSCAHGDI